MDDCLGFYINLDCVIYEDKSFKYRITKEYYKYDKPEFEKEYIKPVKTTSLIDKTKKALGF